MALALGGVFAPQPAHRRFYLAAAILPIFTLVRLTLIGTLPPLAEELLSYLLLGATLIFYQHATHARIRTESLDSRRLIRNIGYAIPIGFALALTRLLLLPSPPTYAPQEAMFAILVAGSVAFVDEYWFRGILQSQIGAVSRPIVGWLATVFLFVAFAADTGDPLVLSFRAGIGLLLGYLVWWRRLLPLAMMTRTVLAVLVGLLAPLELGSALLG